VFNPEYPVPAAGYFILGSRRDEKMEVLIVGGAGEVGRYLVKGFSKQGFKVTILDRAAKPHGMNEQLPFTYIKGDIIDDALVSEVVRGKDVILHLAWSFADDAPTIFGEDIRGHIHLLEAASSSNVHRLIYTSTATVYGRAVVHPVTETHPCLIGEARKPLYALGKYTAEELCLAYHKERGLPVTILRFWWAFGDSIGGRHLRELVKKSLKDEPLKMVQGAGGTFVTMADLGNIIIRAMEKTATPGQIYNVGSLFLKWEEIGEMIVQLTQSNSAIQLIPSEEWKGPAFLNEVWDLSWDKAKRELDYEPEASAEKMRSLFSDALQNCIAQVVKEGK
jgi:nucleoside-diphosphate-sugar epimerase